MNDLNVTQALLKAILELIEKCETLEELRESVKRIMNEQQKRAAAPNKNAALPPQKASREPYPGRLDYNRVRQKNQGRRPGGKENVESGNENRNHEPLRYVPHRNRLDIGYVWL